MVNEAANRVFGCNDLRKHILSFIPKRCKQCHSKMNNNKFKENCNYYWKREWTQAECKKMPNYCNWCYYYVFEYE